MTETPSEDQEQTLPPEEEPADELADEPAAEPAPTKRSRPEQTTCRHCGTPAMVNLTTTPDWLCTHCEHYQDQTICPTCGQVARPSLMKG